MTTATRTAEDRSPYHGVLQIVRFNWPHYVVGGAALLLAAAALALLPLPRPEQVLATVGLCCAVGWMIASIVVSHIVYDRSPLHTWRWVLDVLPQRPARWLNLHAGLDESTPALRHLLGGSGHTFDIYRADAMTESSIVRARRGAAADTSSQSADFAHLPVNTGSVDAAFLLFAAHELRRPGDRLALFLELRRALRPRGRVVLCEHLRDAWNFAAFGPGFLHFLPRSAWTRVAAESRFDVEREFSITRFVRIFVLRRTP